MEILYPHPRWEKINLAALSVYSSSKKIIYYYEVIKTYVKEKKHLSIYFLQYNNMYYHPIDTWFVKSRRVRIRYRNVESCVR